MSEISLFEFYAYCSLTKQIQIMKTDVQIQQDVMAELKWEPFLIAHEIGVTV